MAIFPQKGTAKRPFCPPKLIFDCFFWGGGEDSSRMKRVFPKQDSKLGWHSIFLADGMLERCPSTRNALTSTVHRNHTENQSKFPKAARLMLSAGEA